MSPLNSSRLYFRFLVGAFHDFFFLQVYQGDHSVFVEALHKIYKEVSEKVYVYYACILFGILVEIEKLLLNSYSKGTDLSGRNENL